jgi:hypothetical protein
MAFGLAARCRDWAGPTQRRTSQWFQKAMERSSTPKRLGYRVALSSALHRANGFYVSKSE